MSDDVFERALASVEGKSQGPSGSSGDVFDRALQHVDTVRNVRGLDGDTVRANVDGLDQSWRVAGVDAPESAQPLGKESGDWYGKQASQPGVFAVPVPGDTHGRGIADFRSADGKSLSVESVRNGMSYVYKDYLDGLPSGMREQLLQAEDEAKAAKRGVWSDEHAKDQKPWDFRLEDELNAYDTGQPNSHGFPVTEDPLTPHGRQVHQGAEGGLNRVLQALDYFGNISRSALKAGVDYSGVHGMAWAKEAVKAGIQAAGMERHTSATELKDSVTHALGVEKLRFGKDDGKFDWGDVPDFLVDMAIDVGTDPLTLMSMGLGSLAKKGGLVAKAFPGAAEALAANRGLQGGAELTGDALQAAQKAGRTLDAAKVGIGGALGWGASNSDDPLAMRFGMAAAGAAGTAAGIKYGPAIAGRARGLMDASTDWYYKATGRVGSLPADLAAIHEATESGELMREAEKQAQREIPAAELGDVQGGAQRAEAVEQRTREITQQMRAPLDDYARQEATPFVDKRAKWDLSNPDHVAARAEVIDRVASDIIQARAFTGSIAEVNRVAAAGAEKAETVASQMMQSRELALQGLDPGERMQAVSLMHELKDAEVAHRNKVFSANGFDPETDLGDGLMHRIRAGDLERDEVQVVHEAMQAQQKTEWAQQLQQMQQSGASPESITQALSQSEYNLIGRQQAVQVGRVQPEMQRYVFGLVGQSNQKELQALTQQASAVMQSGGLERDVLEKYSEKVQKAAGKWADNNAAHIQKYNSEVFGLKDGLPDIEGGKGIVGLRWHVDDVYSQSAQKDAEFLLGLSRQGRQKLATAGEASKLSLMAPDASYFAYAEKQGSLFLTEQEKAAQAIARGAMTQVAQQGPVRAFEGVLRSFDMMTNLAKTNQLYFSMSWLKNHFYDHLCKSYMESGLGALVDQVTLGKFQKGLSEDLLAIAKNGTDDLRRTWKVADMKRAMELGVLHNLSYDALMSDDIRQALGKVSVIEQLGLKEEPGWAGKLGERWTGFLQNSVGRIGSYVEGLARFGCYQRVRDMLGTSEAFRGNLPAAEEAAAWISRKTFFDYGDVTMFEKSVMKRLIPFYSFYSKNLPYWLKATVDPRTAGRIGSIQKIRNNIGATPTRQDRATLTPFVRDNGPRYLGKDEHGQDQYAIVPAASQDDAYKFLDPTQIVDVLKEKGNSLLKTPIELATGKDLFSDMPLYPSDSDKGKKYLYSRGFKLVAAQAIGEHLGLPEGWAGIGVDDKGNPYATKDGFVAADKILDTALPTSFLDQISGNIGKSVHDRSSLSDMLISRLTPGQIVSVSEGMRRMQKKLLADERRKDDDADE